jgi:hypothetical protein
MFIQGLILQLYIYGRETVQISPLFYMFSQGLFLRLYIYSIVGHQSRYHRLFDMFDQGLIW